MMMFFLLIVSFFSLAKGQVNADFKYVESCYLAEQTLTLEAVYNGSGTPSLVQWSYSGGTGTNLMIIVVDCTVLGGVVPSGYPSADRMQYKCPADTLVANTYRLTVTELKSDELTESWGATFTPPMGAVPVAVQFPIPVCTAPPDNDNGLSTGAIVGIVIAVVVVVIIIVVGILAIMGKLPAPPEAPPEALIRYCVIIMEDILTWLLGASIGAFWVVTEVLPGGPADGKLEVGYKIYEINDKAVTEENHNKIEEMINDKEILTLRVSKDEIPDTSYVQLKCKKGELLGFKVEHLPMVTEVSDGSKADGKLEKGDRILSINGKSTTGKSIGDINKQLKIPPTVLDLSLKRGKEERNVTLDFKGKALSGIAIKKEKEDIVVSAIESESAAESGDVKEQDCILSVNGVSTAGMKVGDIKDMLTFSVILKVTKDVTLKELDPDKDVSFGFETFLPSTSTSVTVNNQTAVTTVTPEIPANVVKSVTTNGPADLHGIKTGDKIVSINNEETKGKSHQEIKAMLETFGTSISLKIEENDKPNQTNGRGGNDIEMGYVNPRAQDSGSSPQ